MRKFYLLLFLVHFCAIFSFGQYFTHQDSLRGTIGPEREWWDVRHYDLNISVDLENRTIEGSNKITFLTLEKGQFLQIDLQEPMQVVDILFEGAPLQFKRDGLAHFVDLGREIEAGKTQSILIHYKGKPTASQRPPWEGGWTWAQDKNDRPFIATANQGAGASMWWPCKDHPADEAEGVDLHISVPLGLTAVGNGRLISVDHANEKSTFHWKVVSPVNNYGVNINIGHYSTFSETYNGIDGKLNCSYFVLDYNLEAARKQFAEVPKMLEAFEYWFGPYPFYADGYKLVEVPYLGMEHQSSVTYGNKFKNGYLGQDLSQTGHGLLFDFIIIHESAHEWWANSVTAADNADMWIHESFTHYAESIFLEYHYGKDTAFQYVRGVRSKIRNDRPIQGPFGVNRSGSGDMYYKGANIWHMLRTIINDDEKWRNILTGIQKTFRHQTIHADFLKEYIESQVDLSLDAFFKQWFQSTQIPILENRQFPGGIEYRWGQCVENFNMPVDILLNGSKVRLQPTPVWKRAAMSESKSVEISKDFYVGSLRLD